MKPTLTYGLGIAIASAVLNLVLYFAGFHNDLARFGTGQLVGGIVGVLIMIAGLVLGMKAVREAAPDGSLTYGRAVGTGALIGLFAGIFGALFVLLYGLVINPEYHEILYQSQVEAQLEKGATEDQVSAASGIMRFFTGPVWAAVMQPVAGALFATLLSLIIAIFMKRPPAAERRGAV